MWKINIKLFKDLILLRHLLFLAYNDNRIKCLFKIKFLPAKNHLLCFSEISSSHPIKIDSAW